MALNAEQSELLISALDCLHTSNSNHRTVYKRGICLIARRVRHAMKTESREPQRAELRDKLQTIQRDAESIVPALQDAHVVEALRLVGYHETAVEQASRILRELSVALDQSKTSLRLSGRGNSRA